MFLSTDGGALGGVGAAHFAEHSPLARDVAAVVDLDAIAGHDPTRLEFAGDRSQVPSSALLATAAARVLEQGGDPARRPSALRQLLDLAFPFSAYEQAPLPRARHLGADDHLGRRPSAERGRRHAGLHRSTPKSRARLGQIGRSAQQLLASLDEGLELTQGTTAYVWFGARIVRGWAIEIVLVAALLPFLVAAVDLFAFLRRRRVGLLPAIRSLRSRVLFWLFVALLFELFGLVGWWPHSSLRPPALTDSAGTDWPVVGLLVLAGLSSAAWLVARDRLLPRRERRSRGGARGPLRGAARARARRAARRRAERVRARLPAAVAARVAVARAARRPPARRADGDVGGRARRAAPARLGVRRPVRARPRRAVVPPAARGSEPRPARSHSPSSSSGRGRPASSPPSRPAVTRRTRARRSGRRSVRSDARSAAPFCRRAPAAASCQRSRR